MSEKEISFSFEDSQATVLRKANSNLRKKNEEKMNKDGWTDKIDQIKELEDEIQSLHDSIEDEQGNLYNKREELKTLKDPNWKEKEEQQKIKIFLENAEVDLEKWEIVEGDHLKNAYVEDSHVMAFSAEPKDDVSKYQKILLNTQITHRLLGYFIKNFGNDTIKLYFDCPKNPFIFHDGNIWGYITMPDSEEEEEEEIIVPIVEGEHTTELGKIIELQKIIDKAKNLIFAAQDIDCTIDYPYCKEIEIGKPNASMGRQLAEIRSTLEWMDNMCWAYRG